MKNNKYGKKQRTLLGISFLWDMEKNKYVNLIVDFHIVIIKSIVCFFLQASRMTENIFYSTWFSVNVVKEDHVCQLTLVSSHN